MPVWLNRLWRAPWLWIALVIVLFCVPLFSGLDRQDFDNDESIYSFSVDVMLKSGDWLTPRMIPSETLPLLEKPPLKFWIVAAPIRWGWLPANEFGMRFADALMASIAFLYVLAIGRKMAGPICGVVAVYLLFTHGPLVLEHGLRTNNMESAVFLAYAGAVFHFLAWRSTGPDARGHVVAMSLYFVLGFMTKFVAALFLPAVLAIAVMLKPEDRARTYFESRSFALAALIALALIAPWFVYQYSLQGDRLFDVIFGEHVVKRFTRFLDPAHVQPWHFYFTHLWAQLNASGVAWLVAAGSGLVLWKTVRHRWLEGALLILWFALPLAAISTGTSKLYHYAYPFLPPVALAGGYFVDRLVTAIWRGIGRAASQLRPMARTALGAIPIAGALIVLPSHGYHSALEQLRRDAHPLRDLRACLAPVALQVANGGRGPGVWVEGLGFTHRYSYYLYGLGPWEQRDVASDYTVAMHLYSPDSYRPVMLSAKRMADFTAHLSQNPEEVLRGAARRTSHTQEQLMEMFRGSTVGMIPLEAATLLLPGPFSTCAKERLPVSVR